MFVVPSLYFLVEDLACHIKLYSALHRRPAIAAHSLWPRSRANGILGAKSVDTYAPGLKQQGLTAPKDPCIINKRQTRS
jgi:hypothetical protein